MSLQVAPRGPGSVSGRLTATGQTNVCGASSFAGSCTWSVERGSTVELTAIPAAGAGNSFTRWSEPACGTSTTCTLRIDDDTSSVVALFSPVRLGVFLFGNDPGTGLAASPPGAPCSDQIGGETLCREYAANTAVQLTVTAPGSTPFTGWTDFERTTCEPVTSTTCTVVVADEPTSVGARFGNAPAQLPPTISVHFKLRKSGDGRGQVTADKLDCGSTCAASYGYGKRVTLRAAPERGSFFGGWGGACPAAETSCTLPAGPVTSITAVFTRDATPPTSPGGPRLTRRTHTALGLAWKRSTDNMGLAGYRVYRNGALAAQTRSTRFTLRRLRCGTRYQIAVEAGDRNGNRSTRRSRELSTSPCSLRARILRASVSRSAPDRVLEVLLRVTGSPVAVLRLVRDDRVVQTRRFRTRRGENPLRVRLERGVPAGSYLLRVAVAIQAGSLDLPDRRVSVPRR